MIDPVRDNGLIRIELHYTLNHKGLQISRPENAESSRCGIDFDIFIAIIRAVWLGKSNRPETCGTPAV
ncbi:MAG: hypothetical protein HKP58_13170 [Desulfatitalea sp.]|nr:hypothetical protein [Desulfatitalea sp.]NNK01350.1 hypothetical protein [Desulfatitalea sp.]